MTAIAASGELAEARALGIAQHKQISDLYVLDIRQQPKQARSCGSGEKADRRPLDPPPVIRLRIQKPSALRKKSTGGMITDSDYSSPTLTHTLFMFASLLPEDSEEELYLLSGSRTKHVTGSVVSSLFHLKDQSCFVFPDLSVRTEGRWRFKMSLYEIVEDGVHFCTSIITDTFQVYSSKRFPGMGESTDLSRSFASQGLRLRIRRPAKGETASEEPRKPSTSAPHSAGRVIRTSESLQNHSEQAVLSAPIHRVTSEPQLLKRQRDEEHARHDRDFGTAPQWRGHYAADQYGHPLPGPLSSSYGYRRGTSPPDPRRRYPSAHGFPPPPPHSYPTAPTHNSPHNPYPYPSTSATPYPYSSQVEATASDSPPTLAPIRPQHSRRTSESSQLSSSASSARPGTGNTSTTTAGAYRASFLPTPSRSPDHSWERRRAPSTNSPPEPHVAVFSRQVESSVRTESGRDGEIREKEDPTEEQNNKAAVEQKPAGSLAMLLGEGAADAKEHAEETFFFDG